MCYASGRRRLKDSQTRIIAYHIRVWRNDGLNAGRVADVLDMVETPTVLEINFFVWRSSSLTTLFVRLIAV